MRKPHIILLLILLMGIGLRLFHLNHSGIWLDEKISLSESNGCTFLTPQFQNYFTTATVKQLNTFHNVIQATIKEDGGNGILYIIKLHYWQQLFGSGDFAIRMLSLVFSSLVIIIAYYFSVIAFKSERVALITALLVGVHPMLIDYAQEARPYSMATLFSFLSTFFFYRMFIADENTRGNTVAYAIFSLCALLTHYLTCYIFLAHGIYFLMYVRGIKQWSAYIISWIAVIAVFSAWMFKGGLEGLQYMSLHNAHYTEQLHTLKEGENPFILPANFKNVFLGWMQQLLAATGNTLQQSDFRLRQLTVLLIIPMLLVIIAYRKSNSSEKRSLKLFLLLIFAAPVYSTMLALAAGHTISFQPAYGIFSAPYIIMLLGIGFEKLFSSDYKNWVKPTLIISYGLLTGTCLFYHYKENKKRYSASYPNPYIQLVEKINVQATTPSDTIIYPCYTDALLTNIYLPENTNAAQTIATGLDNSVILKNTGIVLFDFGDGNARY